MTQPIGQGSIFTQFERMGKGEIATNLSPDAIIEFCAAQQNEMNRDVVSAMNRQRQHGANTSKLNYISRIFGRIPEGTGKDNGHEVYYADLKDSINKLREGARLSDDTATMVKADKMLEIINRSSDTEINKAEVAELKELTANGISELATSTSMDQQTLLQMSQDIQRMIEMFTKLIANKNKCLDSIVNNVR